MLLSSKAYNTHSCHLESNLASNFLSHKPLKQPSSSASLETGSRAFNHQCRSWFFFPSWFLRWGNCMCDPEVAVTRSSFGFLSFFLELFWVSRLQRWVLGWFSGVIGFWCVWFELEDLQWWLGFICREEGGRRRIALSPIFYRLRSIWKTRKIEGLNCRDGIGCTGSANFNLEWTKGWLRSDPVQLRFNASLGRVEPVQTDSGWFEPGSSQFKSNFEF